MPTLRLQKLEALAIFLAALYFYLKLGFPIIWFIVLLLSIDIFMLGYVVNNKLGARVYNFGHIFLLPLGLLIASASFHWHAALGFSLIWLAHIGMDRTLGYGLKLDSGFKDTHLGKL